MAPLRGGAILPELCLYPTLCYLAGGTYLYIKLYIGISTGSSYHCLSKTIHTIRCCQQLAINLPSTNEEAMKAGRDFRV
jgi:hypothetical protein